jgi:hypothetical protein
MRYMALIYGDEVAYARKSQAELAAEYEAYTAFGVQAEKLGVKVEGEALHPTSSATTVRVRNGKTLTTDGPFAETKEQLGGYYIYDAKDLDEAIKIAAMIPGAKDGSIEIRPIVIFE